MRDPFRAHLRTLSVAVLAIAPLSGVLSLAGGVSKAGASGAPITIAMISSLTGPGASEFSDAAVGFNARIALQNALGGVNGHKIEGIVEDDQTSPSVAPDGDPRPPCPRAPSAWSRSVPCSSRGPRFPNQAGVPVTGSSQDGPEWGQQPYTNMFAADTGSIDPKYPVNTNIGKFLVSHGGNNVASYGYGISPSSSRSAIGTGQSVIHAGGKQGILDTSIPFGSVAYGSEALAAKSANVNAMYAGMDDNSNFALVTALKQAGVNLKAVLFPTGYEPSAIHSADWKYLQGVLLRLVCSDPSHCPTPEREQMQAALEKYDHFTKSQFPTIEQYEAWISTDLMLKGFQLAGKNPTSASTIKALRGIKSYNGNGLLPSTINYTTIFGHDLPKCCGWILQAKTNGFVPVFEPTDLRHRHPRHHHGFGVVLRLTSTPRGRGDRVQLLHASEEPKGDFSPRPCSVSGVGQHTTRSGGSHADRSRHSLGAHGGLERRADRARPAQGRRGPGQAGRLGHVPLR